jgi:hypothetical protein
MKEKYVEECKVLKQNCTYTAEAHHLMAASFRRQAFWFQLVPTIIAIISSAMATLGTPSELKLILTLVSSIIAAVATVLNPNKIYEEHLSAAKALTALKHDARFLAETEATHVSEEGFVERVRNLHEKYNTLIQALPATNAKYFEKARKVIQSGIHEPDRTAGGAVS